MRICGFRKFTKCCKFLTEDCMQMFLKEETPVEQFVRNRNRPLTDIRVVLRIRARDSQGPCADQKWHQSPKPLRLSWWFFKCHNHHSWKIRGTGSEKWKNRPRTHGSFLGLSWKPQVLWIFQTTATGNSLKSGCFPPGKGTVGSFRAQSLCEKEPGVIIQNKYPLNTGRNVKQMAPPRFELAGLLGWKYPCFRGLLCTVTRLFVGLALLPPPGQARRWCPWSQPLRLRRC